jgi:hypothetical protein
VRPSVGQLQISAKTLGSVALPRFCPRCFWIQIHADFKLPYQIFPGIFSSIDSYNKRLVHGWFDRHGSSPPWLAALGEIRGYRNPPHFSKFGVLHNETSVLLRGSPDGILVRTDNSNLIVDYKTAKFTGHQDELLPMYEAQLNAYAYIGESCGLSPVSGLALVYTEPVTDEAAAGRDATLTDDGFLMGFSAHIVQVSLRPEVIPGLLKQARKIHDLARPPQSTPGCKDCASLASILAVASM